MAEKTFTQEEVNKIVQERLNDQKSKYEKLLADKDAEHSKIMRKVNAEKELSKRGIPAELLDLVRLDDDNTLKQSLDLLERNYKPIKEPDGPIVTGKTPDKRGKATPGTDPDALTDKAIKKAMGL